MRLATEPAVAAEWPVPAGLTNAAARFSNLAEEASSVAFELAGREAGRVSSSASTSTSAAVLLPLIGYVAFGPGVNGHVSYSRGSEGRADAKVG